jgi:uncharacterized RDD family membrane protein YckC
MPDRHVGYISEDSKKHFTIVAGVLGALFLIMQIVAPFVVMIMLMPSFMRNAFDMKDIQVDRAVCWNNSMWYTERGINPGSQKKHSSTLFQWPVQDKARAKSVGTIPFRDAYLLAGPAGLWVISGDHVGLWTETGYVEKGENSHLGTISRPFLMDGFPAVFTHGPDGWALMKFMDNKWQMQDEIVIPYPQQKAAREPELRVLASPGHFELFMKYGDSLYSSPLPLNSREEKVSWTSLGKIHGPWSVAADGGTIYLSMNREITVLPEGTWDKPIKLSRMISRVSLSFTDQGNLVALMEPVPGTVRMTVFRGQEQIINQREGTGSMFPKKFMSLMFIPQIISYGAPFLLALILSLMMRRDRVIRYEMDGTSYEFASIIRRGVSMLVDVLILGFPIFLGFIWLFPMFGDMEKLAEGPGEIMSMFGLIFGGFGWAFICFLVFSFMEGWKGVTPGKWLTGIQVLGTDLKPCGFGRAIVRNLLKVVDGFFSFLVGVLVVAFTENWQRVGDMAARTIVIRSNTRQQGQS